ncbi:MAG: Do family serine endopeptidase [Candidatus Zixiibacteriota bacterium]
MNHNDVFLKLRKLFLFSIFAVLFIGVGFLLASGLKWSPLSLANLQATTRDAVKNDEPFLAKTSQPSVGGENPFVKVAEMVSPAVVNISAEKVVKGGYSGELQPFEDFLRRFFGEVPGGQMPARSLGSGFVFRKDGYILTNNHVVAGADKISVKLPDGSQQQAKVVGLDKDTDLAVLKIEVKEDLPSVQFGDSDSLKVGEWVMAIGNPFPQLGLDRTVTVGVVSAKGRGNLNFGSGETPDYQNYIQTDASINPGNSGGPLVNIHGEVVGINSAITNPTGMSFNIGIGFAIPINLARSVIPDLVAKGKVSRGYLGIVFQDLDKNSAEALNLPSSEGVLVRTIQSGTPAEEVGIKTGDVIVGFNGHKVENGQDFRIMVAEAGPGQKVTLDIIRDGRKLSKTLELAERDKFVSALQEQKPTEETKENLWGLHVTTCTRDLADQFGVKFQPGVMVLDVEMGSPAEHAGFGQGDIIAKIKDRQIEDLDGYLKVAGSLKNEKRPILFLVYREGEPLFKTIKAE